MRPSGGVTRQNVENRAEREASCPPESQKRSALSRERRQQRWSHKAIRRISSPLPRDYGEGDEEKIFFRFFAGV